LRSLPANRHVAARCRTTQQQPTSRKARFLRLLFFFLAFTPPDVIFATLDVAAAVSLSRRTLLLMPRSWRRFDFIDALLRHRRLI